MQARERREAEEMENHRRSEVRRHGRNRRIKGKNRRREITRDKTNNRGIKGKSRIRGYLRDERIK